MELTNDACKKYKEIFTINGNCLFTHRYVYMGALASALPAISAIAPIVASVIPAVGGIVKGIFGRDDDDEEITNQELPGNVHEVAEDIHHDKLDSLPIVPIRRTKPVPIRPTSEGKK